VRSWTGNSAGFSPRSSFGARRDGGLFHAILAKAARVKLFGKSPAGFCLRVNKAIWELIPPGLRDSYPVRVYGRSLHSLVRLLAKRQQYFGTFFLRNRPALELMRRLAEDKAENSTLTIAVLACSAGAEVYSILWTIRTARPDLKVVLRAVDISNDILSFAERGVYTPDTCGLVGSSIFERLTAYEIEHMFDLEGETASVKAWLREGITWQFGDASSPELIRALGPQHIVVANNFLCHMEPAAAEKCLRNIAPLAERNGYLFVSGVDLEVRAKVANALGWRPVPESLEQIHDGDPAVRRDWPWRWWGLEPLDRRRRDWQRRYAAVFQINGGS
jgi:chemotaxis methyl-accepting protein methylase